MGEQIKSQVTSSQVIEQGMQKAGERVTRLLPVSFGSILSTSKDHKVNLAKLFSRVNKLRSIPF